MGKLQIGQKKKNLYHINIGSEFRVLKPVLHKNCIGLSVKKKKKSFEMEQNNVECEIEINCSNTK